MFGTINREQNVNKTSYAGSERTGMSMSAVYARLKNCTVALTTRSRNVDQSAATPLNSNGLPRLRAC